jgi:hypothetical protein
MKINGRQTTFLRKGRVLLVRSRSIDRWSTLGSTLSGVRLGGDFTRSFPGRSIGEGGGETLPGVGAPVGFGSISSEMGKSLAIVPELSGDRAEL